MVPYQKFKISFLHLSRKYTICEPNVVLKFHNRQHFKMFLKVTINKDLELLKLKSPYGKWVVTHKETARYGKFTWGRDFA